MQYIEFESAIPYFREKDIKTKQTLKKTKPELKSELYLLTEFRLKKDYQIGDCIIGASEQKFIGTNTISNISKVKVPSWLSSADNEEFYSACFVLVLSSLVSLSSGRSVKFFINFYSLNSTDEIFCQMPLQFAGTGAIDKPQDSEIDNFFKSANELYEIALNLNFNDYRTLVRACRLAQLAHQVKTLDHNLSYAQIVSSIEAVATDAFDVSDVVENWADTKKKIKEVAKEADLEADFRNTLNTKLEQHYTGERFKRFVQKYAPISSRGKAFLK